MEKDFLNNTSVKIYSNCSICLGKGTVETNFRNSNICPSCRGTGKFEQFLKLEDLLKIIQELPKNNHH